MGFDAYDKIPKYCQETIYLTKQVIDHNCTPLREALADGFEELQKTHILDRIKNNVSPFCDIRRQFFDWILLIDFS